MKILCVGFWKTGTKSMAAALKLLGFRTVYDYEEQYLLLNKLWPKFFNGTVTDDEIRDSLKDVDVLIDGPTIVFWQEIFRVFPDAKVILTLRDEESWWESFKEMNEKFFKKRFWRISLLLSPSGSNLGAYAQKIYFFAYGMKPFQITSRKWHANERLYKLKYRMHKSHVLQAVPDESLLVHFPEDGWKPLCEFLGVPIPGIVAYPHKNKTLTFFQEDSDASYLFKKVLNETIFSFCILMLFLGLGGWLAMEYHLVEEISSNIADFKMSHSFWW